MLERLRSSVRRFFSIFEVPILILAIALSCIGCTPAAFASFLGIAQTAAPVVLSEYQRILEAARANADLPPDAPEVKNLAALLARLEGAKQCEATERTAPSVDVDKVTAALRTVAETNAAVTSALERMPRRTKLPKRVLPLASSSTPPAASASSAPPPPPPASSSK